MTDSHHEQIPRARHTVVVPNSIDMVSLLGPGDEHLTLLERGFATEVHVRGNRITLSGEQGEIALAERLLDELVAILRTGQGITAETVERVMAMLRAETTERPADVLSLNILSNRGRSIRPKTVNQRRYVDAIDQHTITFGIGPAGTGKTYLAMAKAVQALQSKAVTRIILTRPAVEAGERLGYLPGTLSEKIDPYLRPLYDALHDMIDPETIPKLLAAGTIEVAPLAYMRGRAQPLDAGVLTPDGFVAMGTLEVGDLVTGSGGLPTPVLGVHPQGREDVYRVTTSDGASTVASGHHLWTVTTPADRRRGRTRTVETRDMVARVQRGDARRYEVPLVAPVEMRATQAPADPYALGVHLGGAGATPATPAPPATPALPGTATVTAADVATPASVGAGPDTACVTDACRHGSPTVRVRLLQGLLDGGGPALIVEDRAGGVRCTTTSAGLREDVVWLTRSLGGTARLRSAADGDLPDVVDLVLPDQVLRSWPERRADGRPLSDAGRPRRFITAIEAIGSAETQCIQVAAADSLYVTDDFIVTHNTLNDAFIILDEAQNTSPEQMKMFLTRLGFGSKIVVTGDVTQVDLPGGTRSGLRVVEGILQEVGDVSFNRLGSSDVVRHRLVGKIVEAYDEHEALRDAHRDARDPRVDDRDTRASRDQRDADARGPGGPVTSRSDGSGRRGDRV